MDSNARKRPRSSTPSKESSPPKKKSKSNKSKTKKSKKSRSNSIVDTGSTAKTKNSMDSTATTDGQIIYQMMSTFSKVEQSRFEAFQRASFPVDAVGDWVAACLSRRFNLKPANNNPIRPLEDLVAVGQAGEIRMVVAVLAKTYAQRLAQAASNAKGKQQSQQQPQNNMMDNTAQQAPLEPEDLIQAYEKRKAQGLDPGLFLQSANERPPFVLESKDSFNQRRFAALAAQEAYEKQSKEAGDKDETKSDKMQVDN